LRKRGGVRKRKGKTSWCGRWPAHLRKKTTNGGEMRQRPILMFQGKGDTAIFVDKRSTSGRSRERLRQRPGTRQTTGSIAYQRFVHDVGRRGARKNAARDGDNGKAEIKAKRPTEPKSRYHDNPEYNSYAGGVQIERRNDAVLDEVQTAKRGGGSKSLTWA